jgi:hypothetical protein
LRSYRDILVTKAARVLAAGVDVEGAAVAVTGDILADVWPGVEDPVFLAALGRSVHDGLRAIFDLLAGRVDAAVVPEAALEFAEVAAHLDVPAAEIHRAYRVYIASLWSRWCSVAQTLAGDAMFDELIDGPTRAIHVYVDPVVDAVVARHEQVHADLHRTRREHRRRLLTQILDGTIDALTEQLDRELGYSLADTHLALLTHNDHGSPSATENAAQRDAVDARGTLVIEHTARTWMVWLGRPGGFGTEHLERLNRLRAAQEILGVSLTARRTDLMVALRLERVLRTAIGESPSS